MSKNLWTLITAVLLVFVLGVYLVTYIVPAGHVGVVKRLGAIVEVKTKPDFYLKWPAPFQTVDNTVDIRTRILNIKGGEVQTSERFNVIVNLAVGWRIQGDAAGVRKFYDTLHGAASEAQKKLSDRVKDARKSVVNGTALEAILSTSPDQPRAFAALENAIQTRVQTALDEAQYGITVDFVYVQSIQFPDEPTKKILTRMQKERERRSQKFLVDGKQRATVIKNSADQEAQKLITEARAKAEVIRGEAESEAAEHFAAFKENVALFKWLQRLDALEKAITKKDTTIILPGRDGLDLLFPEPPKQTK